MPKITLLDPIPREYATPNVKNIVRAFGNETLFVFGKCKDNDKYRWCLGVGRVVKFIKGENFDLLYICFGVKYYRETFVQYNHARRQLLTLKVGQLATFYGKFRITKENNRTKSTFYAMGLQPWYVPKAMDIKQMDNEIYEQIEKEQEKSMLNFLDDFVNNK